MEVNAYLIVDTATNVAIDCILWDGTPENWTPPEGKIAVRQDTTYARMWEYNPTTDVVELTPFLGAGQIGFSWDGEMFTTDQPEPPHPDA